ncbi:MAG: hypothetical protein ACREE4_16490 [Stellaceae bacterium]
MLFTALWRRAAIKRTADERSGTIALKHAIPGGREFSIAHLAPLVIRSACPDIGRDLVIRVTFSNHCYTEKFDPEPHDPEQIVVRDAGGPRVFCPIRHGLSSQLPGS